MNDLTAEAQRTRSTLKVNDLTEAVIGAAMEVHRTLGPGLLESTYELCLCRELTLRGLPFERHRAIPIVYKGIKLVEGYRADLLVDNQLLVELKAVDALLPINDAQILTYLRLGGWSVGLIINFNVQLLKHGIRRKVLNFQEEVSF